LKSNDRSLFRVKEGDIAVMLDCLDELFKEHGEEVMPKTSLSAWNKNFTGIYITILPHTYIRRAGL